jgi:hypothetical protein
MEHIQAPMFGETTRIRKLKEAEAKAKRIDGIIDSIIVLFSVTTFMHIAYRISQSFQ